MSSMRLYNEHGQVKLTDDDWENITETAADYGWEPVDRPEHGHALSEDDAANLAVALHAALASGEVMPHQLIDDTDAEERLELFIEICESGAVRER